MTTNLVKEVTGHVSFIKRMSNESSLNIQLKCPNSLLRNPISFHSTLKKEKNIILIYPNDTESNKASHISITAKNAHILLLENMLSNCTTAISATNSTLASSNNDDVEVDFLQDLPQKLTELSSKSKKIMPKHKIMKQEQSEKKIYEISRFFVKNYIGALKSTVNNPNCESDILKFLGIEKAGFIKIKQELEKLLKEFPKHNRMQLYKLIINPKLNPIFQYFLRRKVYSWIFASSKMQDKQAHLMARKNFLYLCLKARDLTPYNFRIALNFK